MALEAEHVPELAHVDVAAAVLVELFEGVLEPGIEQVEPPKGSVWEEAAKGR